MRLARLLRWLTRFRRVQPRIGHLHAAVLRLGGGRIRRSRVLAGGQPVLALSTTGRRSGTERSTVLAYIEHCGGYAVSALNLGSDRHPAWYLNLRANPSATVLVDGKRRPVTARRAEGAEADELWRRLGERLPATGNSRRLARRDVPVVVLDPR